MSELYIVTAKLAQSTFTIQRPRENFGTEKLPANRGLQSPVGRDDLPPPYLEQDEASTRGVEEPTRAEHHVRELSLSRVTLGHPVLLEVPILPHG